MSENLRQKLTCKKKVRARVVSGSNSRSLAHDVAKRLSLKYLPIDFHSFASGEMKCRICEDVSGCDIFLVQNIINPIAHNIVELLVAIETINGMGARSITMISPYFGYSRLDSSAPAKAIARAIEGSGIERIITVDIHSVDFQSLFTVPFENISVVNLLQNSLEVSEEATIVSPDIGRFKNVFKLSEALNVGCAQIDKRKDTDGNITQGLITGDISKKDCIIVDDIVDSGRTLCNAVKVLQKAGARSIKAFITHLVLSGCKLQDIKDFGLDELIITDSIDNINLKVTKGIRSITISALIAEAIKRIYLEDSSAVKIAC